MFLFVFLSCILIPLNKFPLSIFVPKVTWKLDVDIVGPTACVRQGPWRARGHGRGSVAHGPRRAPPSPARIWTQGLATRGNRGAGPAARPGPREPRRGAWSSSQMHFQNGGFGCCKRRNTWRSPGETDVRSSDSRKTLKKKKNLVNTSKCD